MRPPRAALPLLTCLLCLIGPLPLAGQSFGIEQYTSRDGLVYTHVREVAEDRDGYLWLATRYGLSRYDGYEFTNHSHRPGDPHSLPHTIVNDIFVDREKTLWVIGDGLSRYDYVRRRFQPVPAARGQVFMHIAGQDAGGRLWLTTAHGFMVLDADGRQLRPVQSEALRITMESTVLVDRDDLLWLGNAEGLHRFGPLDEGAQLLRDGHWPARAFGQQSGDFTVHAIHPEAGSATWIGTGRGIYLLQPDGLLQPLRSIPGLRPQSGSFHVNDIRADSDGGLWIAAGRQLLKIAPERDRVAIQRTFRPGDVEPFWLGRLYLTANHTCWVASQAGAYRVTEQHFEHLDAEQAPRDSLLRQNVYAIHEHAPGRIWVGANKGTGDFDLATLRWQELPRQQRRVADLSSISRAPDGTFYFGTYWDGIFWLDRTANLLIPVFDSLPGPQLQLLSRLKASHIDATGTLWLGSQNGLFYVPPDTPALRLPLLPPGFDGVRPVIAITPDRDGQDLWVGIGATLARLDPATRSLSEVVGDFPSATGATAYQIEAIFQDHASGIWVGTRGGGLCRYDPKRRVWGPHFTEKDLLANNHVRSIVQDDAGNIWVGTNKGITRIEAGQYGLRSYFRKDGLPMEEFNTGAVCALRDGDLLFGGKNGIVRFDPATIRTGQPAIPQSIVIDAVRINGEPHNHLALEAGQAAATIGGEEAFFEIVYAALPFQNHESFGFKYRLEGFDPDWKQVSGVDRRAKYMNVPPGRYTFIVALDAPGASSAEAVQKLDIVVEATFWEQMWVRTAASLLGIVLLGALLFFYIRHISNRKKEAQLQRERAEAVMQSLRSQMNPHFIYNSLNSINNYVSRNDAEMANRYLVDFSHLMRLILQHSNSDFISLADELEMLHLYLRLEQLRLGDRLSYTVRIDRDIRPGETPIPPMLIQPFIENAIWHGLRHKDEPGSLMIAFARDNGQVSCHITDDGIGRKAAQAIYARHHIKPKSISTDNVLKHIQTINQMNQMRIGVQVEDLYHASGQAAGTRVALSFSLGPTPQAIRPHD